jgi:hypothetical protein
MSWLRFEPRTLLLHQPMEWSSVKPFFFIICTVGLRVLRPLLAYCTSPRWQVRVIVEKLVEWRLAEETEVLWENLPQRHFVHHKSHMTRFGFESGPPQYCKALHLGQSHIYVVLPVVTTRLRRPSRIRRHSICCWGCVRSEGVGERMRNS